MNIIKYPQKECPLCESKSDKFIKDFRREEVYCGVCGCVLKDNSLPTVSMMEFYCLLNSDESDESDDDHEKIFEKKLVKDNC